ncbi:MAG: hypothetical protein H7174_11965 [Flavobacterium sp.]|nr:hypothetical protein [Flavobacterium sp.]
MKKLVFGLIASIFFVFVGSAQELSKVFLVGSLITRSHLVSISGDCYTVWVGVFYTYEGTESLVAAGTSQIGNCGRLSLTDNPLCKNETFKGDKIYNSNNKNFKYCLIDFLQEEKVNESYQKDKNEIFNSINK